MPMAARRESSYFSCLLKLNHFVSVLHRQYFTTSREPDSNVLNKMHVDCPDVKWKCNIWYLYNIIIYKEPRPCWTCCIYLFPPQFGSCSLPYENSIRSQSFFPKASSPSNNSPQRIRLLWFPQRWWITGSRFSFKCVTDLTPVTFGILKGHVKEKLIL